MNERANSRGTWHRRHVNGVLATVASVGHSDSWVARLLPSSGIGRELLGRFSELREARIAADRRAGEILAHDCSLCQQWTAGAAIVKPQ